MMFPDGVVTLRDRLLRVRSLREKGSWPAADPVAQVLCRQLERTWDLVSGCLLCASGGATVSLGVLDRTTCPPSSATHCESPPHCAYSVGVRPSSELWGRTSL